MRLYKGNAEKLVGKKIDKHRRMLGYYPMEVVKTNGELYVIDAAGVRMPIPEKETDFNCFNFDFVIDHHFTTFENKITHKALFVV